MQMRQIWTRRWIAGNNTLHSSNRGGSLSQHSLLFCCFHKKAASVVGKFPLGWVLRVWSSGINNLLSHDTHLPWDYTLLIRDGTKHFTWCVQRSHFPSSLGLCIWWAGSLFKNESQMVHNMWPKFFWVWFPFALRSSCTAALSGKESFLGKDTFLGV